METILQAAERIVMKLGIRHRLAVGLIAMATVVVTGCAQPPTKQLGAAKEAVDLANIAGATEYAKEDFVALEQHFALVKNELARQVGARSIFRSYRDADKMLDKVVELGAYVAVKAAQNKEVAKKDALAMEKEAQEVVVLDKELMAKVPTWNAQDTVGTIKQDLEALEIGLVAVHQSIEKGDYLGAEVQAKALKEKSLAVSGEIQNTIAKATGEKPAFRGFSRLDHHDARRILSTHSTCEAGPISPMRKTAIRSVERVPLAGRVYAGCYDELV
jgi:hypothetical protein